MKLRLLLLLSAWVSSACAENAQLPPVIDDSVYQSGAAQPARAPGNDAMFELLGRVDKLQNEVQVLRGQVEEQAHAMEELKRRQENIYTDVDERLQKLELGSGGGGALPPTGEAPETQPEISEPQEATSEPEAEEQPSPAPAKQDYPAPGGDTGVIGIIEEKPKTEQMPEAPAGESQQAAVSVPADEKQLYQNAYSALKNGQYDQAIVLLKQLAGDYPSGEYADNAYYWLGETYKIKQDAEASRTAFSYLISNYPTSPKVPDAMLKLGFLELEQNNPDKARELFNTIIKKYAGSSAANLAVNKLQQMDRR